MNRCFTCGYHNLECLGTDSDGICFEFKAITGKPDPNRAIRNSNFKRRATDLERIQAQLDRIEKQNETIISLLSAPISKQEERHNQIISDYNRERPTEIEDADDIDTYDYDTDQLSFLKGEIR